MPYPWHNLICLIVQRKYSWVIRSRQRHVKCGIPARVLSWSTPLSCMYKRLNCWNVSTRLYRLLDYLLTILILRLLVRLMGKLSWPCTCIYKWLLANKLSLNMSKTEFMLIKSYNTLFSLSFWPLRGLYSLGFDRNYVINTWRWTTTFLQKFKQHGYNRC